MKEIRTGMIVTLIVMFLSIMRTNPTMMLPMLLFMVIELKVAMWIIDYTRCQGLIRSTLKGEMV